MSPAIPAEQHAGTIIDGRFTLIRWLGGSRHTSVFYTEIDSDPARPAAIKFISSESVDADARLALWSEAQALSHPNLIRLFYFGRCAIQGADCLYAVTEYAEEVLSEILPERALTPQETREIVMPLLSALGYLHGRKLVHAALKPSNLLVVHDQLKLSVDEICRAGEPDTRATSSPEYDAPELTSGVFSPAADIWSLGMLLIAALTQQPPAWQRTATADPAFPATLHMPFLSIVQECLHVDPSRRATLNAIKTLLDPSRERPAVAGDDQQNTEARKPRLILISSVVLGVALVALIAALKLSSNPTPTPTEPAPAAAQQPAPQPQVQPQAPPPTAAHAKPAPAQPRTAPQAIAAPPAAPVSKQEPASSEPGATTATVGDAHGPLPSISAAALASIHGRFRSVIRVDIAPDGSVASAAVDTQGPSPYFANLALKAARGWHFPATGGSMAQLLQFQFSQSGTSVALAPAPTQ